MHEIVTTNLSNTESYIGNVLIHTTTFLQYLHEVEKFHIRIMHLTLNLISANENDVSENLNTLTSW